jgi:hypothetical protein
MKTPAIKLLTFISFFIFTSCHFNSSYVDRQEDKNEAEGVTSDFYTYLQRNDFKNSLQLMSSKFFEKSTEEQTIEFMNETNDKLGAIKYARIKEWHTLRVEGTDPKTQYIFIYEVERDKYNSIETVSLEKEDGVAKIVGYNVSSEGSYK